MARLRDFHHGDILKIGNGTIGIVSSACARISSDYIEDGKYIFLLLNGNRFYGDLADGIYNQIHEDNYELLGNVTDLVREFRREHNEI